MQSAGAYKYCCLLFWPSSLYSFSSIFIYSHPIRPLLNIFINWNTFSSILFMFILFHLFPFILFTLYIFINSFVRRGSDVRSVITDSTSAIYQFRSRYVKEWSNVDLYRINFESKDGVINSPGYDKKIACSA